MSWLKVFDLYPLHPSHLFCSFVIQSLIYSILVIYWECICCRWNKQSRLVMHSQWSANARKHQVEIHRWPLEYHSCFIWRQSYIYGHFKYSLISQIYKTRVYSLKWWYFAAVVLAASSDHPRLYAHGLKLEFVDSKFRRNLAEHG